MRYIIGTDRETGKQVLVGVNATQYSKVGRKRVPSESNYISLDIRRSPFWKDLRIVEKYPEGPNNG